MKEYTITSTQVNKAFFDAVMTVGEKFNEKGGKDGSIIVLMGLLLNAEANKILFPDDVKEITITHKRFTEVLAEATAELTNDDRCSGGMGLAFVMTGAVYCAEVNKILFPEDEKEEPDPEKALADAINGDAE